MTLIDYSLLVTPEKKSEAHQSERVQMVKQNCAARIFSTIDQPAQMNLIGAIAAGTLDPADVQTFRDGLTWIQAMRDTCAALCKTPEADWRDDAVWPAAPEDLMELVKRF